MRFKFVEYALLKTNILESIRSLAQSKRYDASELIKSYADDSASAEKLAQTYPNISEIRRAQVGLLLTVIRCLDASSKQGEEKELILNAITSYVRDLIEISYDPTQSWVNYLASFRTSASHSQLYVGLGYSLNISKINIPSNEELCGMYGALRDFIRSQVYNDSEDPTKGYSSITPFSHQKIEKFNVEDFLQKLDERIIHLQSGLNVAVAKAPKLASSSLSFMGMFALLDNSTTHSFLGNNTTNAIKAGL